MSWLCLFVCCYKTPKSLLRLPPWKESKPPENMFTRTAQLPLTVLLKVQHHLERLYVPTEVNTLQVDGLARICHETPYEGKSE